MQFKDIHGHENIKRKLINTVKDNRISHAQLFLGGEGCGKLSLALAYAQYIACKNKTDNDSCGVCPECVKFNKLIHPDLHFVYPVVTSAKFSKPVSDDYLTEWRKFVLKRNYHSLNDWLDEMGSENAQCAIFAQESQEILKKLSRKSFESEYKTMIIWMPEKMNETAANKLLKLIEEPPDKTLFLLVSENEEEILNTIRSRTQLIKIDRPTKENIIESLDNEFPQAAKQAKENAAIIAQGNYIEALKALGQYTGDNVESTEFQYFTTLMRSSYANNYADMIKLCETLSKIGREKQKKFLDYCGRLIRECFIMNIAAAESNKLVNLTPGEKMFAQKFSPFIHNNNIKMLSDEFSKAYMRIERNGYNKLVFMNLCLVTSAGLRINKA